MPDKENKRLYLKNDKFGEDSSSVAYVEDLERLTLRSDFLRHTMDSEVHLNDREREIVRNLDISEKEEKRLAFDKSELTFKEEFEHHVSDTAPGTVQGDMHVTDVERRFVELYPEDSDKEVLYTDHVATASFDVYGERFDPDRASVSAIQLNVENYVNAGFITRRQLKSVRTVSIKANRKAMTNHIWDGKEAYLNIIVNHNPNGDERFSFNKVGDEYRDIDTDYEWKSCSTNRINTEGRKYCEPGQDNGKYMTWVFPHPVDLSKANYIVLAFSEVGPGSSTTISLDGKSKIESSIENGIINISKVVRGLMIYAGEGSAKNRIIFTCPTLTSSMIVSVSNQDGDTQRSQVKSTEESKDPAAGTTTTSTIQTCVLSNTRITTELIAGKHVTTLDSTGETVGTVITVDINQTNANGERIVARAEISASGVSATIENIQTGSSISSQADFEQKLVMCSEHRRDNLGGFLFYITDEERQAHTASPAVRMVVNLYQEEGSSEKHELAKMFVVNRNPFQWYAQYWGGENKNVIPLVCFNYDPALANIYQPMIELGQQYTIGEDTVGLLNGGKFHVIMSGREAKALLARLNG